MEDDRDGAEETQPKGRRAGRELRADDILTPKQYLNYQHGRILSGLFVLFGGLFLVVCLAQAFAPTAPEKDAPPPLFWALFAAAGLAGVVGGGAAYQGNRAWARLGYLFAAAFVFGCPIGTAISIFWVLGWSRYMAAWDRIHRARAGEVPDERG